uniref:Methyltransferase type 11 domain-containing protein n=1 Tax=Odontella aurita TaxID=265563 RepID=A0A7S4J0B3_9STRA|mmetsp:Transcript_34650/g.103495  ORF Transcript_34650/g.103495 Transcript_34650/m.103495 type:complete len:321 (+) Transcript_34650:129-1091(+)
MGRAFVLLAAVTSPRNMSGLTWHRCGLDAKWRPSFLRRRRRISYLEMSQWDDIAKDYEVRVEPVTSSFVKDMLEPLERITDQGRAARLLDVGCGTGGATLLASEMGFSVTATDVSPPMVNRLQERSDDGVECAVFDGQCLPEEWTSTFDYAMSSFSVIFFRDPLQGVKEMKRVLVPSGKVVISAWGDRSDSPAFRIIPDAMKEVAPELVSGGVKKEVISTAPELENLLEEAGFDSVCVKGPISRTLEIPTAEEYYNQFALQSPPTLSMISWMRENMGPDTVDKFREKVISLAVERGGQQLDGPIEIVSPAYVAYGTKPSN